MSRAPPRRRSPRWQPRSGADEERATGTNSTPGAEAGDRAHASPPLPFYRLLYAAAIVGWAVVAAAFLAFAPEGIRWPNAAVSIVGGSVITFAVYRPGPRRAILAAALFDALGLILPVWASGGFAAAMVFPLLGSLVLTGWYRGRPLAAAFAVGWVVAIAGMSISFTVGPMRLLSSLTYPPAGVATAAILAGLAYVTLWWVASDWRLAIEDADAATRRAIAGEAALMASEAHYRALIEQAPDGILVLDQAGRVIEVNRAVELVLGRRAEELLGRPAVEFIAPASLEARPFAELAALAPGESLLSERLVTDADGTTSPVELRVSAMGDGRYQVMARDISERRRGEAERARLSAAVEQATDHIVVNDPSGIIEYVNPAFERLTGYSAHEVIGRPVASVLRSGVHPPEFYAELDRAFADGEPWRGMITDRRKDGSLFESELSVFPIFSPAGELMGSAHVGRDVSREREMEADLALEAEIRVALAGVVQDVPGDASVGTAADAICAALGSLPGFDFVAVFAFQFEDEIEAIGHHAPPGFPSVPSASGRRARWMREHAARGPVAEAWTPAAEDGTWGRALSGLGIMAGAYSPIVHGDHADGMLVVGTADPTLARRLLEKVPGVIDLGTTPSAVLADRLHARRHALEQRRTIEEEIAGSSFAPVFQPIVDLATRETVGYEALTRFDSGRRPDVHFAEAWDVGVGPDLELATLGAAVAAATGLPGGRWLDLNVSPRLLDDPGRLAAILRQADRPIILEVTEHEIVADYAALREAVRSLGPDVGLSVDDAGAGAANFRHIVELRPDFVKLDIGLVRQVNRDPGRQALVVAMRHFARTTGCRLVAEGIETAAEARTLVDLGVEFGQGYWLGRPASTEALASRPARRLRAV